MATIKVKNLTVDVIISEFVSRFGREYALVTPVCGDGYQLVLTKNITLEKEEKNNTELTPKGEKNDTE